jgi:hypothetical protein
MHEAQMRTACVGLGEDEGHDCIEPAVLRVAQAMLATPAIANEAVALDRQNLASDIAAPCLISCEGEAAPALRAHIVRQEPGRDKLRHRERSPHLLGWLVEIALDDDRSIGRLRDAIVVH